MKNCSQSPKFSTVYQSPASRRMQEQNDCTVIALSKVLGIKYEAAHLLLAGAGRRRHHGFNLERVFYRRCLPYGPLVKFKARTIFPRPVRLVAPFPLVRFADFVRKHPQGRFIVEFRKHACAVVDAKKFNVLRSETTTPIRRVWEVTLL